MVGGDGEDQRLVPLFIGYPSLVRVDTINGAPAEEVAEAAGEHIKDKDLFNAASPKGDAALATYITNPTLPALIETSSPDRGSGVRSTNE